MVAAQWPAEGPYNLILQQNEVDKANKDKNHKIFPKGFHVEVVFEMLENDLAEQEEVYKKFSCEASPNSSFSALPSSSRGGCHFSDIVSKYPSLNNY